MQTFAFHEGIEIMAAAQTDKVTWKIRSFADR
jgi:hypothetical protein